MCQECPVEVNERVIRAFVRVMNERVSSAEPSELDALAITACRIAASVGIKLNASDPNEGPMRINPTLHNASLCFVLTENGYREADG